MTNDNGTFPLLAPTTRGVLLDASANVQTRADSVQPVEAYAQYLAASISTHSKRAYANDVAMYRARGGLIPATPDDIARYIASEAERLCHATLARRLVAIGREHTLLGLPNPCTTPLVRTTLRGIRRVHGRPARQVAPLLLEHLRVIVQSMPNHTLGIRDRALLLVGFAGALRRSELVDLALADVRFVDEGLELTLRSSKTDQIHAGRVIAIPVGKNAAMCPVAALRQWIAMARIDEGFVFRRVVSEDNVSNGPLAAQSVALIVKRHAARVGLAPAAFSGHSLRAGLVTSSAAEGVTEWKIRAQTGHKTNETMARYIRDARRFDGNAAGKLL